MKRQRCGASKRSGPRCVDPPRAISLTTSADSRAAKLVEQTALNSGALGSRAMAGVARAMTAIRARGGLRLALDGLRGERCSAG